MMEHMVMNMEVALSWCRFGSLIVFPVGSYSVSDL